MKSDPITELLHEGYSQPPPSASQIIFIYSLSHVWQHCNRIVKRPAALFFKAVGFSFGTILFCNLHLHYIAELAPGLCLLSGYRMCIVNITPDPNPVSPSLRQSGECLLEAVPSVYRYSLECPGPVKQI